MSKKSSIIFNHLSALTFIIIYVVYAIYHIAVDSFLVSDQLGLLSVMLPFILIGLALDYILKENQLLEPWIKVITKLLPLGVFIMQIVSIICLYFGKEFDLFNYLFWIFISAPFFLSSYEKEGSRRRIYQAGIGTGAILVVYLFLAVQTDVLDTGYGCIAYFASYFMMLFAVTGIKQIPYLGILLGVINAVYLLQHRYLPLSSDAKTYGWEYNLGTDVEVLIIITFALCIGFYVIGTALNRRIKV